MTKNIFTVQKYFEGVSAGRPARAIVLTDGPESFACPPHRPRAGSMESECRFDPCCAYF